MCDITNIHWDNFVTWARRNGIEFRHPEDYGPFWKCWYEAIGSVTAEHKDEKVVVCVVEDL
ncbi:MAG TPA: hypothetical protein VMY59_04190 [Candidatus Thermoplasmatota archaeon]|nr:hypothetical protein [Candidatus Thermoplasmatota archaeon]